MKRLFIVLTAAALLIATTTHAGWWQTFGGTEKDEGRCVQQTSDGGYIVTGYTVSFGTPGVADIWLIKLNSLGHTEWTKTYETGGGYSVRETSDGGYIIAGSRLIKTDVNGDTIWTRNFEAEARCVQIANDGNYVVTGKKSDDLWLLKINEQGDSLWSHTYWKGNAWNVGHYVEQTTDGGYIITGEIKYDDPELEEYKFGLWLLKTDSLGDTLWEKTYGGDNWGALDYGNCVRQTNDGGYIIAGTVNNRPLIKTDENGDSIWAKSYGGGIGHCVEQTPDGGFIIAGSISTYSTLSFLSTWDNLWLVKTDANGDTTWTRDYGDGSGDRGYYVQQTTDDGYIVVGETYSFGAGSSDLYLLKTDSLGLLAISEPSIKEKQVDWEVVQSMGNNIQIRYSNRPQGFRANIYNSLGQKVDELHSSGSSGNVAWGLGYPFGVYFIRVADENNQNNTARVVLIR